MSINKLFPFFKSNKDFFFFLVEIMLLDLGAKK